MPAAPNSFMALRRLCSGRAVSKGIGTFSP
jgi:hypothetical protein